MKIYHLIIVYDAPDVRILAEKMDQSSADAVHTGIQVFVTERSP